MFKLEKLKHLWDNLIIVLGIVLVLVCVGLITTLPIIAIIGAVRPNKIQVDESIHLKVIQLERRVDALESLNKSSTPKPEGDQPPPVFDEFTPLSPRTGI